MMTDRNLTRMDRQHRSFSDLSIAGVSTDGESHPTPIQSTSSSPGTSALGKFTPPSSCASMTPDEKLLEPCWSPSSRDWTVGCQMIKVTSKKVQIRLFTFDDRSGQLHWESRKWGTRRLAAEDVKELRYKGRGRVYREQRGLGAGNEELWITLIYNVGAKLKSLHIIASNFDDFTAFTEHLEHLRYQRRSLLRDLSSFGFAFSYWVGLAWNTLTASKPTPSIDEILESLRCLGIYPSRRTLMTAFRGLGTSRLDEHIYRKLINLLLRRPDILAIADQILRGDETISRREMYARIGQLQGQKVDHAGMWRLEASEMVDAGSICDSVQSSEYFRNTPREVDDMTQPLWDYYISSSHNTYLLGSQFSGESTVEGYIRALELGCRSVELDCYDGTDGKAVIRHGNSLTTAVSFQTVIETIRQYCFVASPYPLILSLEIHASLEQQEGMASCLRDVFGILLLDKPLPQTHSVMPSPAELMYRVLIKGRDKSKVRPEVGSLSGNQEPSEHSLDSDTIDSATSENEISGEPIELASPEEYRSQQSSPGSTARLGASMAQLMVYTIGCKYRGFNKKERYDPKQMISMSERTCNKIIKTSSGRDIVKHTRDHLVRVYPSAYRVTSKNFIPQSYWQVGVQLSALNWQTWDLGLQMNSALFDRKGTPGYVLKAPHLCGNILGKSQDEALHSFSMSLKLITALFVSRSRLQEEVSLYRVEIGLYAPNAVETKYRSKTVSNEGFHPTWNETFEFHWMSKDLQLVFLRLEVFEDDHLEYDW